MMKSIILSITFVLFYSLSVKAQTYTTTETYSYDKARRLTSVTYSTADEIRYTYDRAGNVVQYYSGAMTTSVDPLGRAEVSLTLSPNPTAETLKLNFELEEADDIHIRIHDVMGNLILEKLLGKYPPGSSEYVVSLEATMSVGIYFIQLLGEKQRSSRSFIKTN